jgi:hypothetical protein
MLFARRFAATTSEDAPRERTIGSSTAAVRAEGTGLKVRRVPSTSLLAREAAAFVRLAGLQDSPGAIFMGSHGTARRITLTAS